jgi:5-methylthioribose kinase
VRRFARLLARIHAGAVAREFEVRPAFTEYTYFETLRLEPYYAYTAAQVAAAAPFLHALVAETHRQRRTLVHGDYSPKNVLVYAGELVLLDFEVMHWGDPAFDVGFALAHVFSKAHAVAPHRTAFLEAAQHFWLEYAAGVRDCGWLPDLEQRAVDHTLGCLLARVAGRSQLEYFSPAQRATQQHIVLGMLSERPKSIVTLVACWQNALG